MSAPQTHPFPFGGHVIPPEVIAVKGHLAACSCGARDVIKSRQPNGIPPDAVAKKLRQLGWDAASNGKRLRCPKCTGYGPRRTTSAAALPEFMRVWSLPCEARDPHEKDGQCSAYLDLERASKWGLKPDGRTPDIPNKEVERQARANGWEVLPRGGLFCPRHSKAMTDLGVVVAFAMDREKALRECAKPMGKQPGLNEAEAKEALRKADANARAVWGENHILAAIAKGLEAQAAKQIQREETDMNTKAAAEPTRDQKRAINAKLSEVHNGEGYADAWTDSKLADALKVPRKWVEDIREEFHGPAVNEAAARERTRLLNELARDVKTTRASLAGLLDKAAALETTLQGLQTRLDAVTTA